jgi:hypothetical protein
MHAVSRFSRRVTLGLCVIALAGASALAFAADSKKPSVSLRANPLSGFSPLKVVLTATIQGGPNDYEAFYCPTVEWDWDDGTKSENKIDCEPYEAGKSEIVRSYTVDHRFNLSGEHRVQFRLKQKNKTVGQASIVVRVQPGAGDRGGTGTAYPSTISTGQAVPSTRR